MVSATTPVSRSYGPEDIYWGGGYYKHPGPTDLQTVLAPALIQRAALAKPRRRSRSAVRTMTLREILYHIGFASRL